MKLFRRLERELMDSTNGIVDLQGLFGVLGILGITILAALAVAILA